jgi:hypothetical protein
MSDLDARAFVRRLHGLVPADFMAEELFQAIPIGKEVLVTIRRARNPKHHRKLFALLRVVTENTDRWANEAVLLEDLKLATGLFSTRVSGFTGMPYPVPASISFAAMDQTAFAAWYERALVKLAEVLGCSPAELDEQVRERTQPIREVA